MSAQLLKQWVKREDGVAAAEAALIFPLLLTLLLGVFDMGNAVLANQKAIRASQVTADLITRLRDVTASDIDEAVEAGALSMMPLPGDTYGVDIVSIRFDEAAAPEIVWRETRNMTPVSSVLTDVLPLASANDGVVVVSSNYTFEPTFAGFVVSNIPMRETAFARGRLSAVVCQEGAPGC